MTTERFSDPDDASEEWIDVRMADPEEGGWDIDVVVVDGRVEYADLRIRPDLLPEFVECLVDDVGDERAGAVLRDVADEKDLDITGDGTE